jgi:hypothetical protein
VNCLPSSRFASTLRWGLVLFFLLLASGDRLIVAKEMAAAPARDAPARLSNAPASRQSPSPVEPPSSPLRPARPLKIRRCMLF